MSDFEAFEEVEAGPPPKEKPVWTIPVGPPAISPWMPEPEQADPDLRSLNGWKREHGYWVLRVSPVASYETSIWGVEIVYQGPVDRPRRYYDLLGEASADIAKESADEALQALLAG